MENVVLKEKTLEAFNYVKDNGGRVSTAELAEALGCAANSVTGRVNSLVKNGLATREKVEGEGENAKPVTYVVLTEDGKAFTPAAADAE